MLHSFVIHYSEVENDVHKVLGKELLKDTGMFDFV